MGQKFITLHIANASQLLYDPLAPRGAPGLYICLCNALTDTDVQQAAEQGACRPREVYEACGCVAQCGSCTKQILALLREAIVETPALVAAIG